MGARSNEPRLRAGRRMTRISTAGISRAEWLALRKRGIGGSDASAIMGVNPYRSAWSVWADKTGQLPAEDETEAMRQRRTLNQYHKGCRYEMVRR